jgi:transposase
VRVFDSRQMVRVGIEGSGNFGRAVAVQLALHWQIDRHATVGEVPTLMTSRERRGQLSKGRADPIDAWPSPGSPPASSSCRRSG